MSLEAIFLEFSKRILSKEKVFPYVCRIQMNQLRKATHNAIKPRIDFQKAAIVSNMVREKLEVVVDT